jgi:vancomycin permeability regulator SanA
MVKRGVAAFLGAFILLNLIGGRFAPHFDANIWWIRLPPVPYFLGAGLLLLTGGNLLAFAAGVTRNVYACRTGATVLALVASFAMLNSIGFYYLSLRGSIHPWVPVPLSLVVVAVLAWIATALWKPQTHRPRRRGESIRVVAAFAALTVTFPLAQMFFFGTTDYRRPADVVVVLGAKTYADGTASQALADRVKTAVELYDQGLVTRLVFSGGPGDGLVSEPQAMRQIAMNAGVREDAIVLDETGFNTDATVQNTCAAFERLNARRVLVVSHAYHLPRVKLAYQRAGWDVMTVPARQSRRLRSEPMFVAREVVAVWAYYLRPLSHLSS